LRVARYVFALVALLLACGFQSQEPKRDERQELYEWFDSLGFEALRDGQFVKVETKYKGRLTPIAEYGFLVKGKGDSFTLLKVNLSRETVVNGRASRPEEEKIEEPADLRSWLEDVRAKRQSKTRRFGNGFSFYSRGADFVLSRIADLRGFTDLATFFFEQSKQDDASWTDKRGQPYVVFDEQSKKDKAPWTDKQWADYAESVKDSLAAMLLEDTVSEFDDIWLSRKEILADMRLIADKFPASGWQQEAAGYASGLKSMVAEDAARKPFSDAQLKAMSPKAQAAELVWQLRNQTTYLNRFPYIDATPAEEATPAARLVKLGFNAVPALLNALHDKRYMRGTDNRILRIGGGPMRIPDWKPLQIREGAQNVLEQIACRPFLPSRERIDDSNTAAVETGAREWWAEAQKLGERQLLIREVRNGASDTRAARLAGAYPSDAPDAIREGLTHCPEAWQRVNLVHALGFAKTNRAVALARDLMKHGDDPEIRLAAAQVVCQTAAEEAVDAMIREWNEHPATRDLAEFLLGSGRARAMKAIEDGLNHSGVKQRNNILTWIWVLGVPPREFYFFRGQKPGTAEQTADLNTAESLLALELQDLGADVGTSGSFASFSFSDPRMCDLAAMDLGHILPKRYGYAYESSLDARERQRLTFLNIWRKSRGLPPVAVPPKPSRPEERRG